MPDESQPELKVCFIVSPIGDPGSSVRKHADTFRDFIVNPVVKGKFKPLRADGISDPGVITTQVIRHLLEAPLVVADLTGHNPNVMYELALRHAKALPFIQMITKGHTIPFDIGHQRTIHYDLTDPYSIEEAKLELSAAIETVMAPGFKTETPIGHAITMNSLDAGNPVEKTLALLVSRLDSLEGHVRKRPPDFTFKPSEIFRMLEAKGYQIKDPKKLAAEAQALGYVAGEMMLNQAIRANNAGPIEAATPPSEPAAKKK